MSSTQPLKTIAIAGAGTMGASMAGIFSAHAYDVILYDISRSALDRALAAIRSSGCAGQIIVSTELDALAPADFLIEAIAENMEVKLTFWEKVSRIVRRDALLATNTSGLSVSKIAEAVEAPERFAGMHWMNPPHIIPLIELIRGEKTAESTVDALRALCLAVGKKPVTVADVPGFVLNRLQLAVLRESLHIVEQGIATREDVDAVMKYALGLRYACLGPFEIVDQGGIDIFHNIASYLLADLSCEQESFGLLKECFEAGHLGVKAGHGFYDYSGDKAAEAIARRDQLYEKIVRCLLEPSES